MSGHCTVHLSATLSRDARKTIGCGPRLLLAGKGMVNAGSPLRSIAPVAQVEEVPETPAVAATTTSSSPKLLGVNGALGGFDSTTNSPTLVARGTEAQAAPRKRARKELDPSMPDSVRKGINKAQPLYCVYGIPDWFVDATGYDSAGYSKATFFQFVREPRLFRLHRCERLWLEFKDIFEAGVTGWDRDCNAVVDQIDSFRSVPVVEGTPVAESVLIVNRYIAYLEEQQAFLRVHFLWSSQCSE